MILLLLLVSVTLQLAVSKDSGSTLSHCCLALQKAGLGHGVISSTSTNAYQASVADYFSVSARLAPQCFFQPRTAKEVSKAVKALVKANRTQSCQFAVRGGGHIHFAGAAGVENGVTIDMGRMNDVVYYPKNSSVSVGAGARWGEVYSYLDKIGIMVTGARAGDVGVAGSTLGGGNSYWAARKGFICDGVRRFEVVLGDGKIVTASRDERPDLFRALKGGGNNFGIVTRFDYDAYEGGRIFGGLVMRSLDTADRQFSALYNFANAIHTDPYTSIILISIYFANNPSMPAPFFMDVTEHTKPAKPSDIPILKEFFSIPGKISDTTGLRNMTSLTRELDAPKDSRVSFSTITFKNDLRVLKYAHEMYKKVLATLQAQAKGNWAIYTLYQPISPLFSQHSNERGGNVLGLDRFKDILILYEPYLRWHGSDQDDLFNGQARFLREEISSYAKSIGADNPWIYLNYADEDQHPLESYGAENVERIRAAAKKYDPQGVFQDIMPGGFKISKVDEKLMAKGYKAARDICWADEAARRVFGRHWEVTGHLGAAHEKERSL